MQRLGHHYGAWKEERGNKNVLLVFYCCVLTGTSLYSFCLLRSSSNIFPEPSHRDRTSGSNYPSSVPHVSVVAPGSVLCSPKTVSTWWWSGSEKPGLVISKDRLSWGPGSVAFGEVGKAFTGLVMMLWLKCGASDGELCTRTGAPLGHRSKPQRDVRGNLHPILLPRFTTVLNPEAFFFLNK